MQALVKYVWVLVNIHSYIYIYIYTERERDRERWTGREGERASERGRELDMDTTTGRCIIITPHVVSYQYHVLISTRPVVGPFCLAAHSFSSHGW